MLIIKNFNIVLFVTGVLKMAGYFGFKMSNNAINAYSNGEKPLTKWSKSDILDELAADYTDQNCEEFKLIAKMKKYTLIERCLIKSSWHHTSKHFNRTDFYSVCNNLLLYSVQELKDILKREKEETKKSKEAKKEAPKKTRARCEFLIWSGTRKHPHADAIISTGEIIGGWFYSDEFIGKKSITANGFKILEWL